MAFGRASAGLRSFFRGHGFKGQSMDCPTHQVTQRAVDQAMAAQRHFPAERFGHDTGFEMHAIVALHLHVGPWQAGFDEFTDGFSVQRAFPYKMNGHSNLPPGTRMSELLPQTPEPTDASLAASGRRVVEIEAQALQHLATRIDGAFSDACKLILASKGRVVATGMGKSGHIARKIAATFASTGTPAFYVHPGEAGHGDLGMITDADVVMALSYSGESDEILTLLPVLKRQGNAVIAMTGKPQSTLARESDLHLDVSVPAEACPLDLAPTSSTTATLAMGDALAVALLEARGFTADDFARSHPAGSLGRRLLLHITDVMHAGDDVPRVRQEATLSEALVEMSRKRLGMTAVVDAENRLIGLFTDGDLRRTLDDAALDVRTAMIADVMTRGPKTIAADQLAVEAARLMETYKISGLIVVDDDGHAVGALNIHDLLRARVV